MEVSQQQPHIHEKTFSVPELQIHMCLSQKKGVVAMLQPVFTAHTIAHKSGHFADTAMKYWPKHGTVVHLFIFTIQSVRHLSDGLVKQNGSRQSANTN